MILRVILLSNLLWAVTSTCPNEWIRFGGSCYFIGFQSTTKLTWYEAVEQCSWNYNSRLVIVETQEENEFIKRQLNALNHRALADFLHPCPACGDYDEFWTFGNDIHRENVWNWGITPNSIVTTFWATDEPNDEFNNEDCLTFSAPLSFYWNDQRCDRPLHYICELSDTSGSLIG